MSRARQAKIENGLQDIERVWSTMTIDVKEYKGGAFTLRSTEDSRPSQPRFPCSPQQCFGCDVSGCCWLSCVWSISALGLASHLSR